jgi:hypothetical protein
LTRLIYLFCVKQMLKDIIDYASEGDIEGIKGQVTAGVSINFQDSVSYRFYILCLPVDTAYPLCLPCVPGRCVHPLTSFCLIYRMDSHLSCWPVIRATWILLSICTRVVLI